MIHHVVFATAALIYRIIVGLGPIFLTWFAFICLLAAIWPDKSKRMSFKPRCLALAIGIAAIGLVILIEPGSSKMRENDEAHKTAYYHAHPNEESGPGQDEQYPDHP